MDELWDVNGDGIIDFEDWKALHSKRTPSRIIRFRRRLTPYNQDSHGGGGSSGRETLTVVPEEHKEPEKPDKIGKFEDDDWEKWVRGEVPNETMEALYQKWLSKGRKRPAEDSSTTDGDSHTSATVPFIREHAGRAQTDVKKARRLRNYEKFERRFRREQEIDMMELAELRKRPRTQMTEADEFALAAKKARFARKYELAGSDDSLTTTSSSSEESLYTKPGPKPKTTLTIEDETVKHRIPHSKRGPTTDKTPMLPPEVPEKKKTSPVGVAIPSTKSFADMSKLSMATLGNEELGNIIQIIKDNYWWWQNSDLYRKVSDNNVYTKWKGRTYRMNHGHVDAFHPLSETDRDKYIKEEFGHDPHPDWKPDTSAIEAKVKAAKKEADFQKGMGRFAGPMQTPL